MGRYKLTLEYDGGPFAGWQRQDNAPSVQASLEHAVEALTGAKSLVYGAGRTDAGVHALGQVAHVDFAKPLSADAVRDGLNHHLRPDPIAVLAAEEAASDFHARFGAIRRAYRYLIRDRRAPLTLERGHVWRTPQRLDADAMHGAAQALVGRHDFTTFRDAQCQAESPVKSLDEISVVRLDDGVVALACAARSFLHRQVRSIVGTLVEVGRGKWRAQDVAEALAAADRAACGPVAPPDGLYLVSVDYPAAPEPSNNRATPS